MQKNNEMRIGASSKYQFNGGLCYEDETSIELNQSPYGGMLNVTLDDGGMPTKRQGQSWLFENSLGEGSINGLTIYKGNTIIAHGTKLYKQNLNLNPVQIYDGLDNSKVFMFIFSSTLYILNKNNYLQYDGQTVKEVEPYKPRVSMNRKPDGSNSEVDESWNMLGRGFRNTFNGDGTAKTYKLSFNQLDADTVICNTGGTEGNGFTVDRARGEITFNSAPPSGLNNVEITAYKTFPQLRENIVNCTFGIEFSNRMFISGNTENPSMYYASGIHDKLEANYFPQKYQYSVRDTDKAVTGFKVQHNKLIMFKEDCTCVIEASTGFDNLASFPVTFLNTDVGCDIPGSIQLINNNIVFANTTSGVNMIVSTTVLGEKNIVPISSNINGNYLRPGLLYEDTELLKKAVSVDYEGKYWLFVGGKVYLLDYSNILNVNDTKKNVWLLFDNFNVSHIVNIGNKLIFGSSNVGRLSELSNVHNDFGEPINALFRTKLLDFGYPDYLKMIRELWYTCKANTNSEVSVKYLDDSGEILDNVSIDKNVNSSFSWSKNNWTNFTWKVIVFAPTIKRKVRLKNVRYFQLEFSNNITNETLSVLNIVLKYTLTKKVR